MDIMTIIGDVIWVTLCFWVGAILFNKAKDIRNKNTALSKETIAISQLKKISILKTEIYDGVIFVFNAHDGTFIAQGANIDEVAANAYKYRKICLACVLHNDQPIWFINGKASVSDIVFA